MFGIEAGIGDDEALYRTAADDVAVNDLINIGGGDASVPNRFGIDHHVRAVFALIEASGLVGANFTFQATPGEPGFEQRMQLTTASWIT